ncbi:MAG: DsbA family protein [Jiangellaceae bacterium]
MTPQRMILATVALAAVVVVALVVAPRLAGGASAAGSDLALDAQPRKGAADPEAELVLFEDFLCPHCATFTETVMPRVEREYGDRVAIYYKNFVVIGPDARRVAHVGECVFDQGNDAFWEFEQVAYRAQDDLDESRALDLAIEYADGIDAETLRACAADDERMDAVQADQDHAQELGLGGTPSVLLNGEEVDATYEGLSRALDAALE